MNSFVNSPTIADSVSSSIFISYSRVQKQLAEELAAHFKANNNSVWFDRDTIAVGDEWMNEIRNGIEKCDEFLTLISSESLQSKVVATEIDIAIQSGKPIFPFVIGVCAKNLPETISQFHYIEIEDGEEISSILAKYFQPIHDDVSNLKILANRSVYPEFKYEHGSAFDRDDEIICKRLALLEPSYPDQSAILLNKGLLDARNENWDEAIPRLKRYAYSADNFAGWYFYALHLPRGENLTTLSPHLVNEILSSIERAKARGSSSLLNLYHELVLIGGCNHSLAEISRKILTFETEVAVSTENAGEFLRFLWCIKASLSVFGDHKHRVFNAVREKSKWTKN